MKWSSLSERQILKAQAEGQLDNLKGAGKPLNTRSGNDTDAAGFRIMAEAGVVPREFEMRKEIEALNAQLKETVEAEARKALIRQIAQVQLRLDIEVEARRKYYRTGD
ncbi:DUF1992 domain-containing protein [Celeribacter ethanolicus]|jgi:hypothetical protein|uniref:DUF1992 domain-containing protein n=1 Tax=Celeribacter ethanolicus TaxID=1758178 RepID=A0A291G7X6_9RHOB|nr:DUF1992 domain-containing protein [Celeribacter ethanolicus]ATG46281.1 DUF1992 domain-containing protein [Celeribacter ethanolicus]